MLSKLKYAALAALGSSKADGQLLRIQAKEAVWKKWNYSCGLYGWKPTKANMHTFLTSLLGEVPNSLEGKQDKLSKDEIDRLFEAVAHTLIAKGAIEVT